MQFKTLCITAQMANYWFTVTTSLFNLHYRVSPAQPAGIWMRGSSQTAKLISSKYTDLNNQQTLPLIC